ncbi:hypothetical protein N7478_007906 [Penicillium angulare]|uniref:uncharacterized protein n=1 Tax=Penicillium angulare TaxID=116970 RepID=UPI0025423F86|nr:uncharacterized protein N7478_007906 [Penicillium angulare]KAJ5272781.1 hypothetical protein N7478_007906 [Penicillium angulare]
MRALRLNSLRPRILRNHGGLSSRSVAQCYHPFDITNEIDSNLGLNDLHPTPSQLLRAAILGSSDLNTGGNHGGTAIQRALEILDQEWEFASPPPSLWLALKGVPIMNNREGDLVWLDNASDLSEIRIILERVLDKLGARELHARHFNSLKLALRRCESHSTYSEITGLVNDILVRFEKLDLPGCHYIAQLGVYYAALNLSVPALRRFIAVWDTKKSSSVREDAHVITKALSAAVDSAFHENPHFNTFTLLSAITSEETLHESARLQGLHRFLYPAALQSHDNFCSELRLLAKLGSDRSLRDMWLVILKKFEFHDAQTCHSAYSVAVTLVRFGRSEMALDLLEAFSNKLNGRLPNIESFNNFQLLIDDHIISQSLTNLVDDETYKTLMDTSTASMEQRMGGDVNQLYPEIQANGCSKSYENLSQIVSLLNNVDGDLLDVTVQPNLNEEQWELFHPKLEGVEFRWCPQQSPINFSDSTLPSLEEQSEAWSPASLGLMRARSWAHGIPQAGANSLHLMQLGYLEMRRGEDDPWNPSGYIVAWDRQYGEMVALYVGEFSGAIDCGPTPSDAPFGTLMYIRPSDMPDMLPLFPDRYPLGFLDHYYLDIDPSADLGP